MFQQTLPDPKVSSPWLGSHPTMTAGPPLQNYQVPFQLQPLDQSGALLNPYPALDPFSSAIPVVDSQLLPVPSRPTDQPQTRPAPPMSHSLSIEFGANSSNAKFRDRIYQQAVTIYLELIKHLNKHRAYATRSNSLTLRYPKPPKAPIDHPPPPQHYNSTGMIGTVRRPSIGHRHSYVEPRAHLQDPRMASWRAEPFESTLLRSPPADRVRNLRRETDQSSTATSLVPSRDQFPVQNAVTALESMTTLCQDSSWRWIDGILLGGSLAYALGEYQKANDWYSKILALDPR
jgi:hypothetical protein